MPRKYIRKSDKQLDRTNLEAAFKHRIEKKCSIQVAADEFRVKKTTLVVSLTPNGLNHIFYRCSLA